MPSLLTRLLWPLVRVLRAFRKRRALRRNRAVIARAKAAAGELSELDAQLLALMEEDE